MNLRTSLSQTPGLSSSNLQIKKARREQTTTTTGPHTQDTAQPFSLSPPVFLQSISCGRCLQPTASRMRVPAAHRCPGEEMRVLGEKQRLWLGSNLLLSPLCLLACLCKERFLLLSTPCRVPLFNTKRLLYCAIPCAIALPSSSSAAHCKADPNSQSNANERVLSLSGLALSPSFPFTPFLLDGSMQCAEHKRP